eukprot:3954902-Prorocentrum_lima.AAC.1
MDGYTTDETGICSDSRRTTGGDHVGPSHVFLHTATFLASQQWGSPHVELAAPPEGPLIGMPTNWGMLFLSLTFQSSWPLLNALRITRHQAQM